MSVFNLFAKMTLDSSSFEAGAKRAESSVKSLGKAMAGYFTAGLVTQKLTELGVAAFKAGAEIADLADQFNLSTDQVQMLQKAADESGNSFETLANVVIKLRAAQTQAVTGNQAVAASFADLNISPTDNIFTMLQKIGEAKGPVQLAAAFDLIGVKSGKILSALAQIQQMGPVELIKEDAIKRLDDVDTKLSRIGRIIKAVTANFLASESPEKDFWSNVLKRFLVDSFTGKAFAFPKALFDQIMSTRSFNQTEASYQAAPLPSPEPPVGESNAQRIKRLEEERKLNERRQAFIEKADAKLAQPFSLKFESSSKNDLAKQGGFFLGAGRTAQLDIQQQQLQKQIAIAERLTDIAKDVREFKTTAL